jgi:hypothetical protein
MLSGNSSPSDFHLSLALKQNSDSCIFKDCHQVEKRCDTIADSTGKEQNWQQV